MTRRRLKFSDSEIENYKKEQVSYRESLTTAFQLGFYVGEQIVSNYLPTLNVDMVQTRKIISVSIEEYNECKRLDEIWFNKRMYVKGNEIEKAEATETDWQALRAYHEMLEEKYLPKTVECYFRVLNVSENDMKEFKKGIGSSLWECDCSHYSVKEEDISVIADERGDFTLITLKRDTKK